MNEKQRMKISKFLSLVLRYEPQRIGLQLDASGWVGVGALLEACGQHGNPIDRAELEEVVAMNEKKRFAFSDDRQRIRASQGHTIDVELGYTPKVPPARLYHGTTTGFVESIRLTGLDRRERHHVHLSAELETAHRVGQRHGRPAILTVKANEMAMQDTRSFFPQTASG
jgi:putative RNA 2'-phosphotransferase